MEISGKIIVVCPVKSGVSQRSGNAWKSQEYVLQTEGTHSEKCVFSVFGEDKIKEFDLQPGDVVSVSINLDAREYNGRWFNSLQAWRVMKPNVSQTQAANQQTQAPQPQPKQQAVQEEQEVSDDELPF